MSISEKLTAVSENMHKVYLAGKENEHSLFWDSFQDMGNKTDYGNTFSGAGWSDANFKPKYDITPTVCYDMFTNSAITGSLPEICRRQGISIDFSKSTSLLETFLYSAFSEIGTVDTQSASTIKWLFYSCKNLRTIENLIIHESHDSKFKNFWKEIFLNDSALENLTISGTGKICGNLNVSASPLSKKSLENVISYLSPEASSKTASFSKAAVDAAFQTAAGAGDGSESEEWAELTGKKENWTITLV